MHQPKNAGNNPSAAFEPMDVLLIGGGMIARDQILPSLYHLQRQGQVGDIRICATSSRHLRSLATDPELAEAFPNQQFEAHPPLDTDPQRRDSELYRKLLAEAKPNQLAVVAVPDHLHEPIISCALEHRQHVLAVKPLVQTYQQAVRLEQSAREKGLFIGIEYHKRLDRRSLDARRQYRMGRLGEFRCGEAKMIEPYHYRHSNFKNWFTRENSDPFTYVGCHYVDLVHFITGLLPVEVSVRGVEGTFPGGNIGYLWSAGQVVWENDAVMSITDGLGYPDRGGGANDQCLVLYCEGEDSAAVLKHDDQYRGVRHCYLEGQSDTPFRFVSPDYFRLVPWNGEGLQPVGYGYESIAALVAAAQSVNAAGQETPDPDAVLEHRRKQLDAIDRQGLLATPANSAYNELVTEAARISIARKGMPVRIHYGDTPGVEPREY
jgi:predicted dehydrogenase